jgi:hypothetical protein
MTDQEREEVRKQAADDMKKRASEVVREIPAFCALDRAQFIWAAQKIMELK